jgi:hypothetical protein
MKIEKLRELVDIYYFIATAGKKLDEYEDPVMVASDKTKVIANELEGSIRSLSYEFTQNILSSSHLSEPIREILLDKYSTPTFEIYSDSEKYRSRLIDAGYNREASLVGDDEVIIIIHLPSIYTKKTTQYREVYEGNNLYEEIRAIYKSMCDAINDTIRNFAIRYNVYFDRINPIGVHNSTLSGGYYYIWRLAPTYRENIEWELNDNLDF